MNLNLSMVLRKLFLVLASSILLLNCAPQKNNPLSNAFHNTTAHFNAYFIANEKVNEITDKLFDDYDWNYDKVLPIYPELDSNFSRSVNAQIEDILEKTSLAIKLHPGSKWEDDSYILLGKARFYNVEYTDAIETFKYVNTKSNDDDARHEALVELMHTFLFYEEINNARAVSDFLKKEKLNKDNLKNLYLNRAYFFQLLSDLDNTVQNLVLASPLINDREEANRINFTIAQIYQNQNKDSLAYRYYHKVLKKNPSFEISLYSKLNQAQVTKLSQLGDLKRTRKYFEKLLDDIKYEEFNDKIYYEMGKFEMKKGNKELALDHIRRSIKVSTSNPRQKGYSYLYLAKYYYDSIKDYNLSKAYYDSTVSVLPTSDELYKQTRKKQEILVEFTKHINTITRNDSLLNLAKMDTERLNNFLDNYIAKKEQEERQKQIALQQEEEKQRQNRNTNNFNPFDTEDEISIGSNQQGDDWYFYNQSALSSGRSEFVKIWGERKLEDNWRRSNKESSLEEEEEEEEETELAGEETVESSDSISFTINKEDLLATIPFNEKDKKPLLDELEEAYYNAGNIYYFELKEVNNAIATFNTLINRFPETEYKAEVLYQLYLASLDLDSSEAVGYKKRLLTEFPTSLYAKLAENPNYWEDSYYANEKLKTYYEDAFELYELKNYDDALALINAGLKEYPNETFSDHLELLKIMITGKVENLYTYQYQLNNFIEKYSESDLKPYAEKLVNASEEYQINLVNSTPANYKRTINETHYFVIAVMDKKSIKPINNKIDSLLIDHTSTNDLTLGNLILDSKYSLLMVSEFQNRDTASDFYKMLLGSDLIKIDESTNIFIISKSNFSTLFETKELDTYMTFYRDNYNHDE
ncbi:MAG TPA: tetratricopeptide repeat protein [Cyclobacteriaceae bacterium]